MVVLGGWAFLVSEVTLHFPPFRGNAWLGFVTQRCFQLNQPPNENETADLARQPFSVRLVVASPTLTRARMRLRPKGSRHPGGKRERERPDPKVHLLEPGRPPRTQRASHRRIAAPTTGKPRLSETNSPYDPTVGLYLSPYSGPRGGGGLFLMCEVPLYTTMLSVLGLHTTLAARYRGTSLIRNTPPP